MKDKNFQKMYKDFLTRYKREQIPIKKEELKKMAMSAAKEARRNYKLLNKPKTNSVDVYTLIWVRDTIMADFAFKAVKPISMVNPPSYLKASVDFNLLFPEKLLLKLRKKLYGASPNEREKIWDNFNLPLKKIEGKFIDMTRERNEFAKNKGYKNRVEMSLSQDKIPISDYKVFVERANELINFCNDQLSIDTSLPKWFYSRFNLPCFMCRVSSIPFNTQNEVLSFVMKHYEILAEFKRNIKIQPGRYSKMSYKKDTDSFEITIDENGNIRHQLMDLIHELAHVVVYLREFKKGASPYERGVYKGEKEATKIEYKLLKKISPGIYKAKFGDALLNFWNELFELELYKNSVQDLSLLYAKKFNRCFLHAKQKENPTYLLDKNIVHKPLFTLRHAIAHAVVIKDLMDK